MKASIYCNKQSETMAYIFNDITVTQVLLNSVCRPLVNHYEGQSHNIFWWANITYYTHTVCFFRIDRALKRKRRLKRIGIATELIKQ